VFYSFIRKETSFILFIWLHSQVQTKSSQVTEIFYEITCAMCPQHSTTTHLSYRFFKANCTRLKFITKCCHSISHKSALLQIILARKTVIAWITNQVHVWKNSNEVVNSNAAHTVICLRSRKNVTLIAFHTFNFDRYFFNILTNLFNLWKNASPSKDIF